MVFVMGRRRLRFTGALLSLLIAFPAVADVETVVRDFYAAYASGDTDRAAALWTGDAARGFQTKSARAFRTRCVVLHALSIDPPAIDGDQATVAANAIWSRWTAASGLPRESEHHQAIFTLRLERGAWRIASWQFAEERLAADIAKRAPRTERERLLRESPPSLRTRRLAEALCRQAVMAMNRSDAAFAAELAAMGREIGEELGDDPAALSVIVSTESVLARARPRNDPVTALRLGQEAVEIAERSSDPDVLARALQRLGRAQVAAQDHGFATSFARVLALDDHLEDASTLALAASQLAWYQEPVALREKLRFALMASRYAEESGDPVAIINSEMNLAGNHIARGDRELAAPHAQRAMELAEASGMRAIQADMMEVLAFAEFHLGRRERFLELTNRALTLLGPNDFESRADILIGQAEYWIELHDYAAADRVLVEAGELLKPLDRSPTKWSLNNAWAAIRLQQGRHDEALTHVAEMERNWSTLSLEALILRAQGRKADERRALEESIAAIEDVRLNIDHERPRTIFFRAAANVYVRLLESFIDEGDEVRALAVAERIKARTLHDVLAGAWTSAPQTGEEAKRFNDRVVELNRRLLAIQRDTGDTTAVRAELRRARGDLDEALARVGRRPAIDPKLPPFDPNALHIARGMTVVEYVIGETKTTAFVIRNDGRSTKIETHAIAISESALRSLVESFTQAMEGRDSRYRPAARRLYDLLLLPVVGDRPSRTTLCVIPDGVLWTLPFQVLIDPHGEHLVERVPLFFAPSLSILMAPRSRPARPPTVLALGNPTLDSVTAGEVHALYRDASIGSLPDAEHEVQALGRLYGARATVRVGAVATEASLKREAGQYNVLHVATHGLVDESSPMYSALLLAGSESEDGLLEAREILSLPIQADLVVLSACDTAGGRIDNGEGMIGLSWAFLGTGCPRTIATQWRVGSSAAADLMIAFHKRLSKQTRVTDVAASLRAAQLEMMQSRYFSHPYYWASFILVGREP
jgi:CHAT domain-containing protein